LILKRNLSSETALLIGDFLLDDINKKMFQIEKEVGIVSSFLNSSSDDL
jgi:hypothetical protein